MPLTVLSLSLKRSQSRFAPSTPRLLSSGSETAPRSRQPGVPLGAQHAAFKGCRSFPPSRAPPAPGSPGAPHRWRLLSLLPGSALGPRPRLPALPPSSPGRSWPPSENTGFPELTRRRRREVCSRARQGPRAGRTRSDAARSRCSPPLAAPPKDRASIGRAHWLGAGRLETAYNSRDRRANSGAPAAGLQRSAGPGAPLVTAGRDVLWPLRSTPFRAWGAARAVCAGALGASQQLPAAPPPPAAAEEAEGDDVIEQGDGHWAPF